MPHEPLPRGRIITVLIGGIDLTHAPNCLASVLGSCIGVAIFDPEIHLAGLAHVLLPDSRGQTCASGPGRFGDTAVPALVRALVTHGAARSRLRARYAGGARMFGRVGGGDIGAGNIAAVRAALERADVPVLTTDVGGGHGRKIFFDPATTTLNVDQLDAHAVA